MSVVILKTNRIWFGYSCTTYESYTDTTNYICDLSSISLQLAPFKKRGCLIFYDSAFSAMERMVLRNTLPDEIAKFHKLNHETLVNHLVPDVQAILRQYFCLHITNGDKFVSFGGSFVLASEDGIFEISTDGDVADKGRIYASRQALVSALFSDEKPLSIEKAKEVIETDSWHYYAGKKIYDPAITGFLGDSTFVLSDSDNLPHEISKEELVCR
jgi:hypothetical protein